MQALSPLARRCSRLAVVNGRTSVVLALLCAALPLGAAAQEAEDAQGAETTHESGESGEAEETANAGEDYEPDQRGTLDQPQSEPESDAGGEAESVEEISRTSGMAAYEAGLHLDISLSLGAALTTLDVMGDGNLVRSDQQGAIGGAIGLMAGVHIGPVLLGGRANFTLDPSFVLVNAGLEAQVMLMRGELVPFVRGSVGVSAVTALDGALASQRRADIWGVGTELGVGLRWYLLPRLFVGADLSGGWHHLFREGLPACTSECTEGTYDVRQSGESDALSLRISLMLGWTF